MSTTSILSSGLTTVIGFLALCLMQFRIGPDLGLALAKGVAISLITVFVFMPALILKTYQLIDKTKHRSFMPSFKGFGKFVSHVMMPVAIGAVFMVLLFTMKSLILPVILVLSIETAIWINLSIPYFSDQTIFYIAYLIISSIQLGATVDYAILFTDRYKEMRQTYAKKEAIVQTISAVSVSVLTSASVLTVVGFLLGGFSTHGLLSQLGYFLGKGTLCSLVIVLFVLPGLLYLFDKLIVKAKKSKEVLSQ